MTPQHIGPAIGVEITGVLEVPARTERSDTQVVTDLASIHQPFCNAAAAVLPQNAAGVVAGAGMWGGRCTGPPRHSRNRLVSELEIFKPAQRVGAVGTAWAQIGDLKIAVRQSIDPIIHPIA